MNNAGVIGDLNTGMSNSSDSPVNKLNTALERSPNLDERFSRKPKISGSIGSIESGALSAFNEATNEDFRNGVSLLENQFREVKRKVDNLEREMRKITIEFLEIKKVFKDILIKSSVPNVNLSKKKDFSKLIERLKSLGEEVVKEIDYFKYNITRFREKFEKTPMMAEANSISFEFERKADELMGKISLLVNKGMRYLKIYNDLKRLVERAIRIGKAVKVFVSILPSLLPIIGLAVLIIVVLIVILLIFENAKDNPLSFVGTVLEAGCLDTTDPDCISKYIENGVDENLIQRIN